MSPIKIEIGHIVAITQEIKNKVHSSSFGDRFTVVGRGNGKLDLESLDRKKFYIGVKDEMLRIVFINDEKKLS